MAATPISAPFQSNRPAPLPGRDPAKCFQWRYSYQFVIVQVICAGGLLWGLATWRWHLLLSGAVAWFAGMFFLTAGYHRYFSHDSYHLSPRAEVVFAFLGSMAAQKSAMWWAAHHRWHHKYSDKPQDVHSPRDGFWWSHMGWISAPEYSETRWELMPPRFDRPAMRWLDKHEAVGPWLLGTACFLVVGSLHAHDGFGAFVSGGLAGLMVVFFASRLVLWHTTFVVNSLTHRVGRKQFKVRDDSRNSFLIALVTGGEGWHNNHHFKPQCARQGFRWWQIDTSYYILVVLSWVGVVTEIEPVPKSIIELDKLIRMQRRQDKQIRRQAA